MYNAVASALRSGPRGLYYGINFRLTSGCSAVASALRSGRRGRWFESTHPDHFIRLKWSSISGIGNRFESGEYARPEYLTSRCNVDTTKDLLPRAHVIQALPDLSLRC